jgi:hypothetical protein
MVEVDTMRGADGGQAIEDERQVLVAESRGGVIKICGCEGSGATAVIAGRP